MIPNSFTTYNDESDTVNAPLVIELAGSASNVQPVEQSHYCYKEVWLILKQITDPTFPLRDVLSSYVNSRISSMLALKFNYRNMVITVTRSAECDSMDFSMKNAVAVEGFQMVVKQGFKMILLYGSHHYRAVPLLEEDGGPERIKRLLRVNPITHRDRQTIGQLETIKLLRITNTSRGDCAYGPPVSVHNEGGLGLCGGVQVAELLISSRGPYQ